MIPKGSKYCKPQYIYTLDTHGGLPNPFSSTVIPSSSLKSAGDQSFTAPSFLVRHLLPPHNRNWHLPLKIMRKHFRFPSIIQRVSISFFPCLLFPFESVILKMLFYCVSLYKHLEHNSDFNFTLWGFNYQASCTLGQPVSLKLTGDQLCISLPQTIMRLLGFWPLL